MDNSRKSSKLNVLNQHAETAFTKHYIVSATSSKTGIMGALQHLAVLFICQENNEG